MPLSISTDAIREKNQLVSDPWLLLLEVIYPGEESFRFVWNTEGITWDGQTWRAASFKLGDTEESKEGDIPTVDLTVIDIERHLTPLIDQYDGAVGSTVIVRVLHADHLDNADPELEEEFEIIDTSIDHMGAIKFSLGAENLTNHRSPPDRFLKGHCRYQEFGGSLCGYSGNETECSRTFERCRELGNQKRFGGFPGVGVLGYWR